jgi:hypothetical protein
MKARVSEPLHVLVVEPRVKVGRARVGLAQIRGLDVAQTATKPVT